MSNLFTLGKSIAQIGFAIVLVLSGFGCGEDSDSQPRPTPPIPNPPVFVQYTPETYCRYVGGLPSIVGPMAGYVNTLSTTDEMCTIGNGKISSNTLYEYAVNQRTQLAAFRYLNWTPYLGPTTGSPASLNCIDVGGDTVVVDDNGGANGICVFEDGSWIAEWTLFRGPSESPQLQNVLQTKPQPVNY